jgi:hypothetical protein
MATVEVGHRHRRARLRGRGRRGHVLRAGDLRGFRDLREGAHVAVRGLDAALDGDPHADAHGDAARERDPDADADADADPDADAHPVGHGDAHPGARRDRDPGADCHARLARGRRDARGTGGGAVHRAHAGAVTPGSIRRRRPPAAEAAV